MSKSKHKNVNKSGKVKNEKVQKKKTPLQIGAVISNWLSFILMIVGLLMVALKLFGVISVTWFIAWLPFLIGVGVGLIWFFFAMIMINVFKKK